MLKIIITVLAILLLSGCAITKKTTYKVYPKVEITTKIQWEEVVKQITTPEQFAEYIQKFKIVEDTNTENVSVTIPYYAAKKGVFSNADVAYFAEVLFRHNDALPDSDCYKYTDAFGRIIAYWEKQGVYMFMGELYPIEEDMLPLEYLHISASNIYM